jgi:hypothetical protein
MADEAVLKKENFKIPKKSLEKILHHWNERGLGCSCNSKLSFISHAT